MKTTASFVCPKSSVCKLYQNKVLPAPGTSNVYRILYCESSRYRDCVRYRIYRKAGICPDFIMPNSKHNDDYILKKIEEGDLADTLG